MILGSAVSELVLWFADIQGFDVTITGYITLLWLNPYLIVESPYTDGMIRDSTAKEGQLMMIEELE